MTRLGCVVANGHLLDVRADVETFDIVSMVEIVAEIVLREIERHFEARVVWGQSGCAQHCDCELRAGYLISIETSGCQRFVRDIQVDLLAAEGNQLLRDWYRVHDKLAWSRTVPMRVLNL